MSDENKPTLGARAPLGIKRTVDVGKVKQSFSHGRTKSVVVEVKRRRVLGRPDGAPEETPVADAAPEAPAPAPAAPVAAPPRPAAEAPRPRPAAVPNDLMSRQERQAQLLREADEARQKMLEDQRRREEAERAEAIEAERRRTEDKRRDEEAQDAAPPVAEPEAAAESAAPATSTSTPAPAPAAKRDAALADDDNGRARRGPGVPVRKEAAKPARGRGEDHRRSGKLTVTRALEGDENGRARSLAALRRAREKERRAHIGGANQAKQVRDVVVPEAITVQELANRMAEKGADLVKSLFKMGSMATINTTIDQDTAELLVTEFGHNIKRVSDSDVEIGLEGEADTTGDLLPRPPVVTIMGHVDHGKTSLLDALRGTDVVAGEAGGITQHIGAYQVKVATGDIVTFLDTPGHEAFTEMRGRGANVTDIVVLVVAGDDGLKPQSIEAISHTKAAGVPLIVAINKSDKPGSKPQKVREELLQHEVVVEDMGGDVQDVEVSALKKTNLDKLLDAILLQAELLELKANPDRPGEGAVIEAKLDKGRGPVATVLVSRGTVRVGDIFVVGAEWGKVRALVDDRGVQVKEAGPSKPVEVLGLSGTPMAGDVFAVVENEARAREIAAYRASVLQRKRTTQAPANLETMFSALKEKQALEYPLIIKGDVQGSVEAIVAAVNKISTDDIKARVLHSGVGGITESDVTLAGASGAPIIGFGVRANAKAREIAEQRGVALKYYDVIYDLVDDVKAAMAGQLGPEKIEHVVGRAEIREVFQAGKHGKAAGLLVLEGFIRKALKARVMRDDVIIYNGSVSSLRRFKDDVAEVRAGLECGVTLESTTDIKAGDYLETFEVEERERTL
ncbi:translation initiation factor IF-2 [Sphingosinicella soli]|uniref:Translation initiation factor IF-2 n=1 Tax=Sphingosinicella soli TaxID=333708 RepID=A0A7W7F5Q2_9SPHN|nr:translation initiation factor IF-2 [Sphingosinicella soli]MBB4631536.1 translation initiation factor IF-2 [Sphingosinicella soli]